MDTRVIVATLLLMALFQCSIEATQPGAALLPPVETARTDAGGKEKAQPPDKDKKPVEKKPLEKKQPETDIFTQSPSTASQSNTGFNPNMMGDFGILFARRNVTFVGTQTTTNTTTRFNTSTMSQVGPATTTTTTSSVTQTRTVLLPYTSSAAAFKVAENESPRPVDRVFGIYNYFGGIGGVEIGANPVAGTQSVSQQGRIGVITVDATNTTTVFQSQRVNADLHREVVGFEKTFLDGYASIEVRLPYLQTNSSFSGLGGQNVGDVTIVTKYAFLLDNATGNVFSAGLAITAPTGPGIDTVDGHLHSTLLQPWFGYIRNFDGFFIQGFHSVVVPTDARDVTLLFTDIGVNYWLYRGRSDRFLNYIVPLAEVHVTTPLNHRDADGVIFVPDQVVFTGGAHFGIMRNTSLSLGVATPLTGPRLFSVEAFAQLNWRF